MATSFTGIDVSPWKLVTNGGKTITDSKGNKQDSFKGYKDAAEAAAKLGGTPVRG